MIQYSNILTRIESSGFKLESQSISNSFGNFFKVYGSNEIELRVSSDRGNLSIDIRRKDSSGRWWDLGLVKAFINKESDLTKVCDSNEYLKFITENFNSIIELFSEKKYQETQSKLYEMSNIRARQLFPDAYK